MTSNCDLQVFWRWSEMLKNGLEIRKAVKKIFILGCCKCSKSYALVVEI
jgi:hypothetical protein